MKEKSEMGAKEIHILELAASLERELDVRMERALERGENPMGLIELENLKRDFQHLRDVADAGGDMYEMLFALVQPKGEA